MFTMQIYEAYQMVC